MRLILITIKCIFVIAMLSSMASAQDLKLDVAKDIANKALNYARSNSWKVSVAIVNKEGNLVAFVRDDGSYSGSIDSSIQKATAANAFQRPTSAFSEMVQSNPGILTVKGVVAVEGGLPLSYKGQHIGAIGVSGAKASQDTLVAREAIRHLND